MRRRISVCRSLLSASSPPSVPTDHLSLCLSAVKICGKNTLIKKILSGGGDVNSSPNRYLKHVPLSITMPPSSRGKATSSSKLRVTVQCMQYRKEGGAMDVFDAWFVW